MVLAQAVRQASKAASFMEASDDLRENDPFPIFERQGHPLQELVRASKPRPIGFSVHRAV